MVKRKLDPKKFFSEQEKEKIVRAIREMEKGTSGEICVFLEKKVKRNILDQAKKVFKKLGMSRTKLKNGVLIYFSVSDRQFSILGDQGIHEKLGQNFWKEAIARMERDFSQGEFAEGLIAAIREVGKKLREYFPHPSGDINELPDEIRS